MNSGRTGREIHMRPFGKLGVMNLVLPTPLHNSRDRTREITEEHWEQLAYFWDPSPCLYFFVVDQFLLLSPDSSTLLSTFPNTIKIHH